MNDGASAAVVGSGGFIGKVVVHALTRRQVATRLVTRSNPLPRKEDFNAGGTWVDVATIFWAASSINPLIAETRPDLVVEDREALLQVTGALVLLPQPPVVVLLSSGGAIYDGQPPHSEASPVTNRTAYARAKLEQEEIVRQSGVPFVSARISNAYGPGQPIAAGQGVIAHWMLALAQGRKLELFGNPSVARDYIFETDVADALTLIHLTPRELLPNLINIGSGEGTSLERLFKLVTAVAGASDVEVDKTDARSFDASSTWLDTSLARNVLKWAPTVALENGLRLMWNSYVR